MPPATRWPHCPSAASPRPDRTAGYRRGMAVKVSVVVAVFNPGRHIEPLLESLRTQTMPADEFEVIFVDDGSTDGTPERLEQLAKELPFVHALRVDRSGGPSR